MSIIIDILVFGCISIGLILLMRSAAGRSRGRGGQIKEEQMRQCTHCGSKSPSCAVYCGHCGQHF